MVSPNPDLVHQDRRGETEREMPNYPIYSSNNGTTAETHFGWMPSSSPLINAYAAYTLLVISGYLSISTCQFLFVEGRGRYFTGVLSARAITKLDAERGKTWGWSLLLPHPRRYI
jgi:hypothetical protein